ncbi:MAG: DUF3696 domain-containing protein [Rhodocyclales bacterium]|nr:DUF3696 domain-containing protein [Rhodocyclales bacterium]
MEKKKTKNTEAFGVNEIYMKGFQVFGAETHIPLRRLTMLYGPNSAGKSAVEDAISLLSSLCRKGAFDTTERSPGRGNALAKHWRRAFDDVEGVEYELVIGVKAKLKGDLAWEVKSKLPEKWIRKNSSILYNTAPGLSDIDVRFRYLKQNYSPEDQNDVEIAASQEIVVDGITVSKISEVDDSFELNFNHPCLKPLRFEQLFAEQINEIKGYSVLCDIYVGDGWLRLPIFPLLDRKRHINEERLIPSLHQLQADHPSDSDESYSGFMALKNTRLFAFTADVFNALIDCVIGELSYCLDSLLVPASRKIPSDEDLTYFFNQEAKADPERFHFHTDQAPLPKSVSSDPTFLGLANSYYARLKCPDAHPGIHNDQPYRLNRLLREHLFSERSYFLECDYRFVLSLKELRTSRSDHIDLSERLDNFPAILRLYLSDEQGRAFSFSDVGSGVGYVLPVVNAFCEPEKPLLVIQQPELHLHPALQSDLGDVLIAGTYGPTPEYTSRDWRPRELPAIGFSSRRLVDEVGSVQRKVIVETHSEHLLLRILKRIRNSLGNSEQGELSLSPNDVAILYFDPQPNGTTKVIHIPIAANGEFGRRWPRGFFTEREKDLIDE